MSDTQNVADLESALLDLRCTPYSLFVPSDETQATRYGSGPTEDVAFVSTPLGKTLGAMHEVNLIAVAELATHHDHRLRPKVRQAHKALQDSERNVKDRNDRVEKANATIYGRLEALQMVRDDLMKQRVAESEGYNQRRQEAICRCAEATALVGLSFDPENPLPKTPDPKSLMVIGAHAAKLQQPHCPNEKDLFWVTTVEWMIMALVGTALGFSIGAVGGIIHLSALAKQPGVALLCAAIGTAVAMVAGASVKALWRNASEGYHLGVPWKGRATVALLMTLVLAGIETVVDMRGIMAAANLHNQVGALSGKVQSSDGQGVVLTLLLGATLSVAYFTYAAMCGWRKERRAADNLIILSQEEERLARLKELHLHASWSQCLAACNHLIAVDASEKIGTQTHELLLKEIVAREQGLRALLQSICYRPNSDEVAIIDKAITEAEGQQTQFDHRLKALLEGTTYDPRKFGRSARPGFWSRIWAFFKVRRKSTGGA